MKAFYHATTFENASSIARTGLVPTIGANSEAVEEPVPAVFLFASKTDLENALGSWLGELFEENELAILRVMLSDAFVREHCEKTENADWEIRCFEAIPPENIEFFDEEMKSMNL